VTVVTGFLGSGKTTLINRILTGTHGLRLAVVVQEYGEIGIDDALVARRDGEVTELVNGCQYCGDRNALPHALARIAGAGGALDGVIIESSGLADPLGIVEVLADGGFARGLVPAGVVSLVDCANFDANLANATVAYQQLAGADLLLLTKTDLVDDEVVGLLRTRLRTLNRHAGLLNDHSGLPVDLLLGVGLPDPGPTAHTGGPAKHGHHHEIDSLTLAVDQLLDQSSFLAWTETLPPEVVRAKGLVRFTTDPRIHVMQRVGARESLHVAPPAASGRLAGNGAVVVLFGTVLDCAALAAGLQACSAGARTPSHSS
jgi:G3E family GTPase